jgi:hypothetical protein
MTAVAALALLLGLFAWHPLLWMTALPIAVVLSGLIALTEFFTRSG